MSIEFKKLSDVDSVEELADDDYVLAVTDADSTPKKIKVANTNFGGGGNYYVTINTSEDTETESFTITDVDKTPLEIYNAYTSGMNVIAKLSINASDGITVDFLIPLNACFTFSGLYQIIFNGLYYMATTGVVTIALVGTETEYENKLIELTPINQSGS